MSLDAITNFGYATLSAGIDSDDTSITLTTGQGARLPAGPFNAVIWDTSYGSPTVAYHANAAEIVRVTTRTTDTLSPITRAQEGTTARSFNTSGRTYAIAQTFTKATYDLLTAKIITGTAMAALAVDTSNSVGLNTKTVSADSTLTFSATPTTGKVFRLRLSEGGGAARTITIPSSYSQNRGATITSFTLPAYGTVDLVWHYDGSTYYIYGDPVTAAQVKAGLAITSSDLSDFNSATRAQVESALIAGSNITITPGSSGATRTLTIASTGGGSGSGESINVSGGTAATSFTFLETIAGGVASTDFTNLFHYHGGVANTSY